MVGEEFYVAFIGSADRFAALSRFFDRLVATKSAISETPTPDGVQTLVSDSAWIDSLDNQAIERLTREGAWALEDILDCVLQGEYTLVGVTFDGRSGRLIYEPWAYPFGGHRRTEGACRDLRPRGVGRFFSRRIRGVEKAERVTSF